MGLAVHAIAHVVFTAVAPIGFVQRNLVAAWYALHFLIAHNGSIRGMVLDGPGIQTGRQAMHNLDGKRGYRITKRRAPTDAEIANAEIANRSDVWPLRAQECVDTQTPCGGPAR